MPRITMAESFRLVSGQIEGRPRKIANNTFTYHRLSDGAEITRLHRTDIVSRHRDGRLELNTDGWKTVTTKDRINSAINRLGYAIQSIRGDWYVARLSDRKQIVFRDGMTLPAAFNDPSYTAVDEERRILVKSIKKFIGLIDGFDKLPLPDNGDCWFCLMFDKVEANDQPKDSGMGHARENGMQAPGGDLSHLQSHLDEGYINGSLLVNAMRWAGYRDQGIAFYLHDTLGRDRRCIKSALRRYLRHRFGMAR